MVRVICSHIRFSEEKISQVFRFGWSQKEADISRRMMRQEAQIGVIKMRVDDTMAGSKDEKMSDNISKLEINSFRALKALSLF